MSLVSVVYKFSTYKAKAEPGCVLNEVLQKSVVHFKVESENKSWILTHHGKELPLTVPLRLLNLPKGAKLELNHCIEKAASEAKMFRVKFQVLGRGVEVVAVQQSDSIIKTIENICEKNSWTLDPQVLKLQCFSKVWNYEALVTASFAHLGILEDVAVRLTISNSVVPAKPSVEKTPSLVEYKKDHTPPQIAEKPLLHEVLAYVPNETPSTATKQNVADEDYEVSIGQFKSYQRTISKSAGSNELLTKRMREEQENAKKHVIDQCNIRVRFPDRACIDINFNPDETMNLVYEAIKRCLADRTVSFRLYYSHPHKEIEDSEAKLVADLGFGSKTLLVFETNHKGPYLKEELLQKAKTLADAQSAALQEQRGSRTNELGEETSHAQSNKVGESSVKSSAGLRMGQKPKWLKLGKK
ncbi:Ubx4p [Lachancea thermotolerans CBS 6340]|uniref:KLTH0C01276p n=1 Tax=Lachancea thermotolerans (strain ATCC 56472 / CBS 6340 / NRRL Y-8284) TaxID=559295 RepID=C5DDI6_LACTC|nr:KLTH0C01276p [Lachancea thermotolerans CBS 6340]CAR21847.1 KLTH0C01276p [Lachancea thermotolerans CBS 6340]